MSEHLFYEFRALERPLSAQQQAALRMISSRATITARRFTNVYNYSDIRADPLQLLSEYFDVYLHITNYGHGQFAIRLPPDIPAPLFSPFLHDECLSLHPSPQGVVLCWTWSNEGESDWIEDHVGGQWLDHLQDIRDEVLSGDLRPLFLGWLAGQLFDEDNDIEAGQDHLPPMEGLGTWTAAQASLAQFLRLPSTRLADEVAIMGERAPSAPALDWDTLAETISAMSVDEQRDWLVRLAEGEESNLHGRFLVWLRERALKRQPPLRLPTQIPIEDLDGYVETATVDCYDEAEQASGFFSLLVDEVVLPFQTWILGSPVRVVRLASGPVGSIVACCVDESGREQDIPLQSLPLPLPLPTGADWIAAWSQWARDAG